MHTVDKLRVMATRTNVYIDGFNLYYGCLKGGPYKWLDVAALSALLLPNDNIQRIRYFTGAVGGRPADFRQPQRQQVYLRALRTIPNLTVHLGNFQTHERSMPLARPQKGGPVTAQVLYTEEKGSDVNLATYLLLDAFQGQCDTAVVISNDSDLAEPIDVAMNVLGIRVGVVNPHRPHKRSRKLQDLNPTFFKQIFERGLKAAQFRPTLTDVHGTITKPPEW